MKIIDINGSERDCVSAELDKNFPGNIKATFKSKTRNGFVHDEWYPVADFLNKNPSFAKKIGKAIKQTKEDLGVVSTALKTGLTDKKKKWEKDVFIGLTLWISRGKGEGQTRNITANNQNSIAIDKPWSVVPDKTSQYVISRNVHNPKVFNNTLPGLETPQRKTPKPVKIKIK